MAKIVLSELGIELRGRAGNAVFSQTKHGLILRPYTVPRNPRTPAQQAARARFARVSALYKTLTPAQRDLWNAYARTFTRPAPSGEKPRTPTPYSIFVALGSKYLQVHPTGTPPLVPPPAPFFGDNTLILTTGGSGEIIFTASAPNAAGVTTELLWQPLAHGGRLPRPGQYRTQGFFVFVPGTLSHRLPAAPGWYAPAYRFVNTLTGQETERALLDAVLVE